MTAVTVDRGAALKEWAAVVKALESGTQMVILRKGGIREEGFAAESETFFFYPTGFHQTSDKLRTEHKHFLEGALAEKPPEGKIRIRALGRVVEKLAVSSTEKLAALSSEYVYTVDEMKKRYEFRHGDELTALAVRVFVLPRSVEIPVKTKYGGCVSWIHLEETIATERAAAVLSDGEFRQRLDRVRSILL